ncbi:hypothetical protein D9753_02305 [Streptomyces dangxiongensis]|uniref:Uncharacterized protein n=1 Tax=Streptomyces dangxiongensis TaxID=1442032 RepID=A0A3G2JB41_9ACTN|nr:hypothetical protein [Streptomyces dangxiongensis]AYN37979.1 hypothetical protein D9753_02305 [Streptomyces dangxiongensis]
MTVQIAEELARLHRLMSWYDVPQQLPATALTGEACVWCSTPVGSTDVQLEPTEIPRRGCAGCYTARLAWYVSWYDWHLHVQTCTACQQRQVCYVGHGRRVLHELTIGPADRDAPVCIVCVKAPSAVDLVVPVRWEGDARLYLGYAHAGCASGRWAAR